MPKLRQIACSIEWGNTKTAFTEHGTTYGDGIVETYVTIPDQPQPFAISVTSRGFIAEGLAIFVFIDGKYHCNRNRVGLKPYKKGQARDETEINLRLRQKEDLIGTSQYKEHGMYLGRPWRFDKHNLGERHSIFLMIAYSHLRSPDSR